MTRSIQSELLKRFEERERRALAFVDRNGEASWLNWGELAAATTIDAGKLAAAGLGRGDVCILVLPSDQSCATLLLGILSVGARPLLVAPPVIHQGQHSSLLKNLADSVRRTGARLVICDHEMSDKVPALVAEFPETRFLIRETDLVEEGAPAPDFVQPSSDEIVAMQLTSGTTGSPRVCVWKQESLLNALEAMAQGMKIGRDDVCLNWTPLYHDMGLVNNFFLCLSMGIPLVMLSAMDFVKDPALWLRSVSNSGSTVTWSPNFGFALAAQRIRDEEMEGVRLDHVTGFWNAAERIHLKTMLAFHERFESYGLRFDALKTNFGCAENIGGATFSDPDGQFVYETVDRQLLEEEGTARVVGTSNGTEHVAIVSAGRPAPGLTAQVLSATGELLPDGRVGELALRTPSRMEGYLGDEEGSEHALFQDLLRTGDLGYLRDGEVFWVGRVRERINLRGRKFDPSDFEQLLFDVDGLRKGSFAAFGIDDERVGSQNLIVVAEVRDAGSSETEQISAAIREKLFEHFGLHISDVVLVRPGTLTKTSSGKRRHRHFRELYLRDQLREERL